MPVPAVCRFPPGCDVCGQPGTPACSGLPGAKTTRAYGRPACADMRAQTGCRPGSFQAPLGYCFRSPYGLILPGVTPARMQNTPRTEGQYICVLASVRILTLSSFLSDKMISTMNT